MIELFVENKRVDIDKGFSTILSLAIDDIKDFGAKNSTFSKTIILPGTKNNNVLFGNIFNINAGATYNPNDTNIAYNFNAAISAKAYIFADNMQVFKGIFRILEIVIDDGEISYECACFGEMGGFIAKLGNKKLEELDFSAYNHSYTAANIVNSWSATFGSGYVYPLIDYGNYSSGKANWDYKTFRPALFVKEYIDKIFEGVGYAYDCALFNTTRFKNLIVPHNQKQLTRKSGTLLDVQQDATIYTSTGDSTGFVPLNTTNVLGSFTASGGNTIFTNGATAITSTATLTLNVIQSFINNPTYDYFTVAIYANGTFVAAQIIPYDAINYPVSLSWSGTISASLSISAVILGTVGGNPADFIEIENAHLKFEDSNSLQTVQVNIGEDIYVNSTIPQNILQKDFISSIVKLFNLYLFEDYQNDKVLKIMPFVDFYEGATAIDWSNKVDRSKPMKVKPMSELNSRYFEFNFKNDSDYYNDLYNKRYNLSYGSYKYDSEFEFANESTKVELIFSATPAVGYVGQDKVYSTIFKRSGDVVGVGEEQIDSNIRILQAKKITGVASWNITSGGSTISTNTAYLWAGMFDNPDAPANSLEFGVPKELFFALVSGAININQFNVYWSSYLAEITDKDSRLLSCTVRLAYKDIYQLDFSKLIYIDGNLYRLNKIEDFNASEPDTCKVELLKVINKIY